MALNNVPLSGQTLAGTRVPINQNFATINAAFLVNHVEYGLGDQGKHKLVQFVQQAAGPVTSATELALYTKAVSGAPQLFLRRQNSGTEINLTSSTQAQTGYMRMPNGILVRWGLSGNVTGTTTFAIPVVAGIPAFTGAPFHVQFTLVSSNIPAAVPYWLPAATTALVIGITMTNTFTGTATTGNVAWYALGV